MMAEQPEVVWTKLMRRAGATELTVPQCMGGEYGTAVATSGDMVIGTVHVETHECPLRPGVLCWLTLRDAWRAAGGSTSYAKDDRPLEAVAIAGPHAGVCDVEPIAVETVAGWRA